MADTIQKQRARAKIGKYRPDEDAGRANSILNDLRSRKRWREALLARMCLARLTLRWAVGMDMASLCQVSSGDLVVGFYLLSRCEAGRSKYLQGRRNTIDYLVEHYLIAENLIDHKADGSIVLGAKVAFPSRKHPGRTITTRAAQQSLRQALQDDDITFREIQRIGKRLDQYANLHDGSGCNAKSVDQGELEKLAYDSISEFTSSQRYLGADARADVSQEAMSVFLEGIRGIDPDIVPAYCRGIAARIIRRLETAKRRSHGQHIPVGDLRWLTQDATGKPKSKTLRNELLRDELALALSCLTCTEREIVSMRFGIGTYGDVASIRDIADRLERPARRVSRELTCALDKLRRTEYARLETWLS